MEELPQGQTVFDRLIYGFALLTGFLFLYSMLSTCVEVVLRYFFARPTNWIMETNEFILYISPFLASAWVLKQDGHVKMDLIVDLFSRRNQARLNAGTSILAILICLTIIWFGLTVTWDSFQTQYVTASGYIRINRGYITIASVLGFVLLAIQFLRRAIFHLRQASSGET